MPIFTPPSPALQKAWWKETIVYQIYPRSFKDSNDDGIGDLNGITEKLDYLHGLGIETLWLNPIFASPNADNGYDISDYRQIMPDFGTMEDFDRLLKETHARGMRLLLDLVLNHTSDQHPWFCEARTSRENPYYDYYLWWPEEQGHPPYRKSHFDEKGDAWCYNAPTRSYYLHYFARQQPDLNWQSPKVRAEIYDILRFWLDKGVDGFRLDSIPYIAKDTSFPEIDLRKYPDVFPYYSLGPHLHDYLHEMNREVFSRYDCTTVGEGSKTAPEEGWKFIAPERQELDMLYHFGAADIRNETEADDPATGIPYSLLALKRMYAEWDAAVGDGWPTIYLGNHDQPRMVSRFGSDAPEWRDLSAKMLTMFLLTMRGTPYWLAGDELGMTGENDPGCRGGMAWAHPDKDLLAWQKELIALRQAHPALRTGSYTPLLADDEKSLFAFARGNREEELLAVFNLGERAQTWDCAGESVHVLPHSVHILFRPVQKEEKPCVQKPSWRSSPA